MRTAVAAALAALACGGCGGGSAERPVVQFPSKDDLQRLAARPSKPAPVVDTAPADQWTIDAAIPAPGAPYPSDNVWDRLLVAGRSASSQTRLAPELRCAAQESARFYVKNGAFPDDSLREYLLLRCGSTLVNAITRTLSGTVPDETPDARVQESYAKSGHDLAAAALAGGAEAGIGFARGNGRAAAVAFYGTPVGRLRAIPGLVQGASVTLEGDAAPDASFVMGFATQGAFGVALCEPDSTVKAPMFRLSCPVADGDLQTRIEIGTRKAGQVLMRGSLQLLVRRQSDAGLVYEARPYGSVAPAANAGAFRSALVDGLNAARAEAGVRALALEPNQSRDNDALVSPYFDSALRGNAEEVDTMALGLLAGWDVGGTIRDGGFYSELAVASRSPGRWLTHALASPFGRWSLLDSNMARVAIGAGVIEPSGVMALVTTYAFFESSDHHPDEDTVFERLARARKEHGAPPPSRVPSDATLDRALSKILINAASSAKALHEVMQHIASDERRSVSGWYVETSDLKDLPFTDDLLARRPLEVQIGVTHHKAPGGAWGQYAVLIAIMGNRASDTKEAFGGSREVAREAAGRSKL
ncbi:MAG TPA: hypothetical protein VN894_09900 [Polyangiaceae bacterium]|nr:hypothetical protein [Polyangiaceae bacterium]